MASTLKFILWVALLAWLIYSFTFTGVLTQWAFFVAQAQTYLLAFPTWVWVSITILMFWMGLWFIKSLTK